MKEPFLILPPRFCPILCTAPWCAPCSLTGVLFLFFIQLPPVLPSRLSSDTPPPGFPWFLKARTWSQLTWWGTVGASIYSFHEGDPRARRNQSVRVGLGSLQAHQSQSWTTDVCLYGPSCHKVVSPSGWWGSVGGTWEWPVNTEKHFFCQVFPLPVGRGNFSFSLYFVAHLCFCWDFKRELKKRSLVSLVIFCLLVCFVD